MSKYCPICDDYTNCTDCCDACIEEERKFKMNELIDRIHAEEKEYLDFVAKLPPEAIIRKAYEICWREEFICLLENTMFDDETLAVLQKTPHLLDVLYDEWLKTDASVTGMLTEVIDNFMEEESNA